STAASGGILAIVLRSLCSFPAIFLRFSWHCPGIPWYDTDRASRSARPAPRRDPSAVQRRTVMLYVFGDYSLDTQRCEVQCAGQPVTMRARVFQVLVYLLTHRDRVVPKQELCEQLWPTQFISDATLDGCIAEARRALGDSGRAQRVIHTRHGY